MIVLTSPTFGDVTIGFTDSNKETRTSNIPSYARDNSSTNTKDTATSGAIKNSNVYEFSGLINDNDAGLIPFKYDVEGTAQSLRDIHDNSELITLSYGGLSGLYFVNVNPVIVENVTIKSLELEQTEQTGLAYTVKIMLVQETLVNTIYNPSVIKVKPSAGKNDKQKKSLSPQNNGTVSPVGQDISDLKSDLGF